MGKLNVANRTLAVMDNYPFLRSLNNECIDLIAIDPPFAANETFTSRPRPPITQAEFDEEVALAGAHGAAHNEGIGETRVQIFGTGTMIFTRPGRCGLRTITRKSTR